MKDFLDKLGNKIINKKRKKESKKKQEERANKIWGETIKKIFDKHLKLDLKKLFNIIKKNANLSKSANLDTNINPFAADLKYSDFIGPGGFAGGQLINKLIYIRVEHKDHINIWSKADIRNFLTKKNYSNEKNFRILVNFIPDGNEDDAFVMPLETTEIFTLANKEKALKRIYAIFEEEIGDFLET